MSTTKSPLVRIVEDLIKTDKYIRKQARRVLSDFEVYGDSHGAPTIEDIVDKLVKKVKEKV